MPGYPCCCDQAEYIFNAQFTILPKLGAQAVQLIINAFNLETFSPKSYDPCIDQATIQRPFVAGDATSSVILIDGGTTDGSCDISAVEFELTWIDGLAAAIAAHADSSGPGGALVHGAVDQTAGSKDMVATLDVVDVDQLLALDPITCAVWRQLRFWLPMKLSPWFARTNDEYPSDPDIDTWAMGWAGPLVIEQFCTDTNKPDPDDDDAEVPRVLTATISGVALGHTPNNMTEARVAAINGTSVTLFRTHDEVPCTIHSLFGWGGGALTGGTNSEDYADVLQVYLEISASGGTITFAALVCTIGAQRVMAGVRVGIGGDLTPADNGNWEVDDIDPFTCKSPLGFWNNHTNIRTDPATELDFSDATITIT